MGEHYTSSSIHLLRPPVLSIRRCGLFAQTARLFGQSKFELDLPDHSPALVYGQNGSGKSLMTSALRVALGPFISDDELRTDLLAAGIERIEVDLDLAGLTGQLRMSLQSSVRVIHWNPLDESNNGGLTADSAVRALTDGKWESLFGTEGSAGIFAHVNIVHGGEIELLFNDDLLQALREEAVLPTRRELAAWSVRLHELAGENGVSGRLGQARDQLRVVEERLSYVEVVWSTLDHARRMQSDLQARLEELTVQHSMVKAELEEWMKVISLAERAQRVQSWLDEMHHESDEVAWLRDQHAKYQERLDALEDVFRGVPDNMEDLLQSYQSARQEETALLAKLEAGRLQGSQLEEAIAAARGELNACVAPSLETDWAEQERYRFDIERAGNDLNALLRDRTELGRRREAMQLQIQREFPLFHFLHSLSRAKLKAYFEWEEEAEERALQCKRDENEVIQRREEKLQQLREELTTSFSGFEALPNNAAESLREFFNRRLLVKSLREDQEELDSKRVFLESHEKSRKKPLWTTIAGLIGAITGGLIGGWDIALFFGLAASGIVMLGTKMINIGFERQLEFSMQSGNLNLSRLQESSEIIERLQASLTPLDQCLSLDEALEKLNDYRQTCLENERLSEELPAPNSEQDPEKQTRDDFALYIPDQILALSPSPAKAQYVALLEVEKARESLERKWNDFEEGGARAIAVKELETQISRIKLQLDRSVSNTERQMQIYEARRRELNEQLTVLESARAVGRSVEQVQAELAWVRERMNRLASESGGLLERMDSNALLEQVRALRELRAEIRKVRDSLSSRQSLDELRARAALLAEELEEVKQKLSDLDPLYLLDGTVADFAAKYARQLEATGEALASIESALEFARRDLESVEVNHWTNVLSACESLESLRERANARNEYVKRMEHDFASARDIVLQLQSEHDEQFREHHSELLTSIGETVRRLSDGRCHNVTYANGRIGVELPDGSVRSLTALSAGLRDLLWCAVRLTLLDRRGDSPLTPAIWDEPFTRLDDHFLERVKEAVHDLAQRRQVIILSRDQRLRVWGTVVQLPETATEKEHAHA